MTVSAVSNVYQYSTTYQAQFFGTSISSERINSLMKEYGVIQTGDERNDLQSLFNAMYNYFTTIGTLTNSQKPAQTSKDVPWAPLMAQVGLSVTGDLSTDYAAFNQKINFINNSSNEDYEEENRMKNLQQVAPYVFVQPQPEQQSAPSFSGADITAMVNKAFLLGL